MERRAVASVLAAHKRGYVVVGSWPRMRSLDDLRDPEVRNWRKSAAGSPSPHELCERAEEVAAVLGAIQYLHPVDARVVRARLGLDGKECTLQETAALIGASPERARQRQLRGLARIRRRAWRVAFGCSFDSFEERSAANARYIRRMEPARWGPECFWDSDDIVRRSRSGYAPEVRVELRQNGRTLPVAQAGRGTLIFDKPVLLTTTTAELLITIGWRRERWLVYVTPPTAPSRILRARVDRQAHYG